MTMVDAGSLRNYWTSRIDRDLTPFIDPGTELILEGAGRVISAVWIQRGSQRRADFTFSFDDGVTVDVDGRASSYKSFFAGPGMADLLALAKTTLQVSRTAPYVQTKARLADVEEGAARAATELLQVTSVGAGTHDATTVVMVTGEAGAGKTSVLRQLVAEQAEAYARGRSESLFLYVNAQGRALARFHEALATELQDLRATLTYHGVSTLVRLGLLVPVIDGFDELLGVGGYDDAFSSLAQFIEELDGEGCVIASARSTYYQQEFVTRANRATSLGAQVWRQVPVEVLAWGDEEIRSYVEIRSNATQGAVGFAQLAEATDTAFKGVNAPLRHKPLFVARTVDLILSGVALEGDADLVHQVVSAFVERERTEKLLNKAGGSLLTAGQIVSLLSDVAEEMWNQETRELDRRSAQELAELALLDVGLDEDGKRVVSKRMPDLAFLMPGEKGGAIAFEHETFFYFFLAARFAEKLSGAVGVSPLLLSRSVMPRELAENVWREARRLAPNLDPGDVIGRLCSATQVSSSRSMQVRENVGILVSQVLVQEAEQLRTRRGLTLFGFVMPGGSLEGVELTDATLRDIELRRTDCSRTRLLSSHAEQVRFFEVLVDPTTTRFELTGVDPASDFIGLRVVEDGAVRVEYDPEQAHEALVRVGAAQPLSADRAAIRKVAPAAVRLLQRFVRAYNRSNPLCTADDTLRSVFKDPLWDDLQHALIRSGVVTSESRDTRGAKKVFLRRQVLPSEIIAGARRDARVPGVVIQLWDRLEAEFPGK